MPEPRMNLRALIMTFCENWGPSAEFQSQYHRFVDDLREVCEAYGKAALRHESLPDTEHRHGDPI